MKIWGKCYLRLLGALWVACSLASGVDHDPSNPKTPHGNIAASKTSIQDSPLFKGAKSASFSLEDSDGNHPEIILLEGTTIASTLTRAAYYAEKDAKRKSLMKVEPRLRMQFAGLVFELDPGNSEMVKITLVGRSQEFSITKKVARSELESGNKIEIVMPEKQKNVPFVASVKGNGSLKIRYNKDTDSLEVIRANGSVVVNALGSESSDSGEIKNATGIRKDIERRINRTGDE